MSVLYLKVCNHISVRKLKFNYSISLNGHHKTAAHCYLPMHVRLCSNSSMNNEGVEFKCGTSNQDYLSSINTRVRTCLSTGEWSQPDVKVESALAMEYSYRQKLALTKEYEYEKEQIYERMYTWTPER